MSSHIVSKRLIPTASKRISTAAFSTGVARFAPDAPPEAQPKPAPKPKPVQESAVISAPRSYGKKVNEFTPQPLPKPIGMLSPPRPGQNTGIDTRSIQQKREDLTNWDKHLERREFLKTKIARPYFRDWDNIKFHDGKSFIAPIRVFRADKSLYFPNLHGLTLEKIGLERDSTPLFTGNLSVVALFSGRWAENQIDTWLNPSQNPELAEVLKNNPEAQVVRFNVEENSIKAWLIKLYMGSLRKTLSEEDWNKYFVVKKGITDEIREHIGFLNSKVGYVYIVDQHCRIRWAGSGPAHPIENESLAKGLQYVVDEFKKEQAEIAAKKATTKAEKE
ncbi:hypothetical protein TD95_002597 [Thielaviopsis punctulata]|uniref:Uncharacterized protein n=1 Tax=Thielaviopsis punctulata TaxID=72032 RepID=A0A0F4ZKU1_9PEZI|nr:hypothetical protein TD95_002597 [Thielaviopsis punctulata]